MELILLRRIMTKKLFVGNLAYSMTDDQLSQIFSAHGKVVSANIISDRFSGRSKGFGFVEFETEDEAAAAMKALDGAEQEGRNMVVKEAIPRNDSGAPATSPSSAPAEPMASAPTDVPTEAPVAEEAAAAEPVAEAPVAEEAPAAEEAPESPVMEEVAPAEPAAEEAPAEPAAEEAPAAEETAPTEEKEEAPVEEKK